MKTKIKLLALVAMMSFSVQLKAQITLDYSNDSVTFAGEFYCTDIGNNDFKYVYLDHKSNKINIYNMDLSPFIINIQIPVSDSLKDGFTVAYITKTLFDCDSTNIEYVYERPFGGGLNDPFRIFRTDGTLLFEVDSAVGPFADGFYGGSLVIRPVLNTSSGTKLLLAKKNEQWGSGIQIYSLCGELTEGIYDFSERRDFVKISPNPTNGVLNFEVIPPSNNFFTNNAQKMSLNSLGWRKNDAIA